VATGRKTVVVGQVIDPVVWGNPLWDQSVQTFASAADRTAQFATLLQGAVTYLEDVKQWQGWNGAAWVILPTGPSKISGGKFSGTTSAAGVLTIPHGLGAVPSSVVVTMGQGNSGTVYQVAQPGITNYDGTNFLCTIFRSDTGAGLASTAVVVNWVAVL
jgi:hypothetical protein